jgi:hypothetical protein
MYALAAAPLSLLHFVPCMTEPAKTVSGLRLYVSPRHKDFDWRAWVARQHELTPVCDGAVLVVDDAFPPEGLVRIELLVRAVAQSSSERQRGAGPAASKVGVWKFLVSVSVQSFWRRRLCASGQPQRNSLPDG